MEEARFFAKTLGDSIESGQDAKYAYGYKIETNTKVLD
jgi:hypothetical protein